MEQGLKICDIIHTYKYIYIYIYICQFANISSIRATRGSHAICAEAPMHCNPHPLGS